jgi:GTPase
MKKKKTPLVAIVGRTNVGKSTLFNAIAGRRLAIVEDAPGVTRDRSYTLVRRYDFLFNLCDTGGITGDQDTKLQDLVRDQAEIAVSEADLIIALFDGVEGPNPLDHEVVELLRRSKKPTIWVVNKCEKPANELLAAEFYGLGMDELHFISAAHQLGVRDLVKTIGVHLEALDAVTATTSEPRAQDDHIRVAVLGRPNVGKSTLINKIIGEERLVTSDIAGTTRDSIDVRVTRDGRDFVFVDTAGLRKKARVEDSTVERYGNLRTLRSLAGCDVAVLVLDATLGVPSVQDTKIGSLIHERGRGFVIVVNKWDAIEKDHRTVKAYTEAVQAEFRFAKYAPIVFVSALTGRRCPSVLEAVRTVYDAAKVRVKTADVNRVLKVAFEKRPPAAHRGIPVKLMFATQVAIEPPTFVLFLNQPAKISYAYQRYIKNSLREHFPFPGIDMKLQLRKRSESGPKGPRDVSAAKARPEPEREEFAEEPEFEREDFELTESEYEQ